MKNLDIVKAIRNAREETAQLLNDQGLTVLSLAISNFIAEQENGDNYHEAGRFK